MNIVGAWKRGYTGKDVVITILDDGIERNHPDLIQNYVSVFVCVCVCVWLFFFFKCSSCILHYILMSGYMFSQILCKTKIPIYNKL